VAKPRSSPKFTQPIQYLPLDVLAELHCGFILGTRAAENEAALNAFLAQPGVSVLTPDATTAKHYAAVYAHLRRQGTPIPNHDMWIAAQCLQHDLVLYARDDHFRHVPELRRL
jgi:predicted nucleic acid-binding protein